MCKQSEFAYWVNCEFLNQKKNVHYQYSFIQSLLLLSLSMSLLRKSSNEKIKKKKICIAKNNNKKRDDFFSISMSIVLVGRSVGQSLTDENFWKWMKKLVIIRFDAALYTHTDWHWKWWWKLRHIKSISINGSQNFLFSSIFWIVWYF